MVLAFVISNVTSECNVMWIKTYMFCIIWIIISLFVRLFDVHSFVYFLFRFSVRVAGCCCFLSPWGVAGLTGAKSSSTYGRRPGYALNESPAHCRTLTDGSGYPTGCQLHISTWLKIHKNWPTGCWNMVTFGLNCHFEFWILKSKHWIEFCILINPQNHANIIQIGQEVAEILSI